MPNRNEKVLIAVAAAAGFGVGTFLFIRYRKNLISKFLQTREKILHDFVKAPRTSFDLHIINNVEDCGKILKIIKE